MNNMTRYIDDLPNWSLQALKNLRDEAVTSIDIANASGDPNSAIISDSQFTFVETLIKNKS